MTKLREEVKKACLLHESVNSQKALAEHLGIKESSMSRILSNRRRRLTAGQSAQIAEFLGMDISEFTSLLIADEEAAREENSVEKLVAQLEQNEKELFELHEQLAKLYARLEELEKTVDPLVSAPMEQRVGWMRLDEDSLA